jgi:hypothetical protein
MSMERNGSLTALRLRYDRSALEQVSHDQKLGVAIRSLELQAQMKIGS